jgi:ABC-type phosphate transport system ATPase subunit
MSAVNPAVSAFCNLAEMYDLAKPLDPSLIAKNVKRSEKERLEREKQVAIEQSLAAMKKRDFDDVVQLLGPYETQLRGADKQRLSIAKTRSGCD